MNEIALFVCVNWYAKSFECKTSVNTFQNKKVLLFHIFNVNACLLVNKNKTNIVVKMASFLELLKCVTHRTC